MVPGLAQYEGLLGKAGATVDGGYYSVTPDGRPLIGAHGARNAFVCGGMGTYGLMSAPVAGELVALHVVGDELPSFSGACSWPRSMELEGNAVDLLDSSSSG